MVVVSNHTNSNVPAGGEQKKRNEIYVAVNEKEFFITLSHRYANAFSAYIHLFLVEIERESV